jgi:hypothetical protein
MTFLDAALTVLREQGAPMTTREITAKAIERGFIEPTGKTPANTMSATLYTSLRAGKPPSLRRVSESGPKRALRGSVRWALG